MLCVLLVSQFCVVHTWFSPKLCKIDTPFRGGHDMNSDALDLPSLPRFTCNTVALPVGWKSSLLLLQGRYAMGSVLLDVVIAGAFGTESTPKFVFAFAPRNALAADKSQN